MAAVTHLLDTHAVLWAYQDSQLLGAQARSVIEQAADFTLGISDFTLLEVAMLANKNRLQLAMPLASLLHKIEQDYVVLPLGAKEAAIVMELALPQADPFDRVIVATALCHQITLLTKDRQITESGLAKVLW